MNIIRTATRALCLAVLLGSVTNTSALANGQNGRTVFVPPPESPAPADGGRHAGSRARPEREPQQQARPGQVWRPNEDRGSAGSTLSTGSR